MELDRYYPPPPNPQSKHPAERTLLFLQLYIYMLNSDILTSLNFNKNQNLVPYIEGQPCIKILLRQFSHINAYQVFFWKNFQKKPFNAFFFSNPGDNFLILVESKIQMCPIVFTLFGILSPRFCQYLSMTNCGDLKSKGKMYS